MTTKKTKPDKPQQKRTELKTARSITMLPASEVIEMVT